MREANGDWPRLRASTILALLTLARAALGAELPVRVVPGRTGVTGPGSGL